MSEQFCHNCKYAEQSNIGLLCMGQKGMPHTSPYGSCDSWKSAKNTNADRIRSMTDEELDEFLNEVQGDAYLVGFNARAESRFTPYGKKWLDWLKQEANE